MAKQSPARTGVPLPVLNPADLLTPDELAARLKVSKQWIYDAMRPGKNRISAARPPIPCIKMGRYLRFNWPDISEWLQKRAA